MAKGSASGGVGLRCWKWRLQRKRGGTFRDARFFGFTLMELLVVIGIIVILAAMLLPVLVRAKAQGQSISCKGSLHQMSLAMNMYVEDARRYPFLVYFTDNTLTSGIQWASLLQPYYSLAWTNRAFHCPGYKGYIVTAHNEPNGGASSIYSGSYGYNSIGGARRSPPTDLGLGPTSRPGGPPTISAAQVLAPGDMIMFGESLLQRYSDSVRTAPLWSGSDWLFVGPGPSVPFLKYPMAHGQNCNIVFCDTHVESMRSAILFNPTNTASRWNNDHQPHPETW